MCRDKWYYFAELKAFQRNKITTFKRFNSEYVGFLDANGNPRVYHAFCPHLGAHLGFGGKLVGDEIVCPFHGWRYNLSGSCTKIPYCERIPPRAKLKVLWVKKIEGHVFAYLSEDEDKDSVIDEADLQLLVHEKPLHLLQVAVTVNTLKSMRRELKRREIKLIRSQAFSYFESLPFRDIGKVAVSATPISEKKVLLNFLLFNKKLRPQVWFVKRFLKKEIKNFLTTYGV